MADKMQTYLLLLRGINVGGKNKIVMAELKVVLEEQGFQAVKTYINSGNVIFRTDQADLQRLCHGLIAQHFALDVACAVYSAQQVLDMSAQQPDWFNRADYDKHNAIFVLQPWTAEMVVKCMPAVREGYELLATASGMLFWTCQRQHFSKTSYSKISKDKLVYGMTTIRNGNTFRKLTQMVADYVERYGA